MGDSIEVELLRFFGQRNRLFAVISFNRQP